MGGPKISTAPRQPRVFSIFVLRPFINKSKDGDERRMLKSIPKKDSLGLRTLHSFSSKKDFRKGILSKRIQKDPCSES